MHHTKPEEGGGYAKRSSSWPKYGDDDGDDDWNFNNVWNRRKREYLSMLDPENMNGDFFSHFLM